MSEMEPELVAALEGIADDLAARGDSGDLAARFEWLVDVLIMRGHLAPGHRKLIGKVTAERSTVKLALFRDKHAIKGPDIDCVSLLPLCKGRCCTYAVTLSAQDVADRTVPWEVGAPYVMPKDPTTGYCTCMRADGGCGIYADRPATCRAYDCRHDPRVWIDFEQKIPAPLSAGVVPLGEWPDR